MNPGASPFDWCSRGQHDVCPREHRPFWVEGKTRIRYRDSVRRCTCTCHT